MRPIRLIGWLAGVAVPVPVRAHGGTASSGSGVEDVATTIVAFSPVIIPAVALLIKYLIDRKRQGS